MFTGYIQKLISLKSNSNSMENFFWCNFIPGRQIATNFGTCNDWIYTVIQWKLQALQSMAVQLSKKKSRFPLTKMLVAVSYRLSNTCPCFAYPYLYSKSAVSEEFNNQNSSRKIHVHTSLHHLQSIMSVKKWKQFVILLNLLCLCNHIVLSLCCVITSVKLHN